MNLHIHSDRVLVQGKPSELRAMLEELTALMAEVDRHAGHMAANPHNAAWCREAFDPERHHNVFFEIRIETPPSAPTAEPG